MLIINKIKESIEKYFLKTINRYERKKQKAHEKYNFSAFKQAALQ